MEKDKKESPIKRDESEASMQAPGDRVDPFDLTGC